MFIFCGFTRHGSDCQDEGDDADAISVVGDIGDSITCEGYAGHDADVSAPVCMFFLVPGSLHGYGLVGPAHETSRRSIDAMARSLLRRFARQCHWTNIESL